MKFIYLTLTLLVAVVSPLTVAAQGNRLSSEAANALHAPEKAILYYLNPDSKRDTNDITLHGFKILKQVMLEGKQAVMASAAFELAITQGQNRVSADCFEPRHALRVKANGQTYDFLLCYQCGALYVYRGKSLMETVVVRGSPEVLSSLLVDAKAPMSKSGDQ
jgi:hypothetical protein